ncbi:hypothetical protein PV325_000178, partial [Microctonus aethiopoides]
IGVMSAATVGVSLEGTFEEPQMALGRGRHLSRAPRDSHSPFGYMRFSFTSLSILLPTTFLPHHVLLRFVLAPGIRSQTPDRPFVRLQRVFFLFIFLLCQFRCGLQQTPFLYIPRFSAPFSTQPLPSS